MSGIVAWTQLFTASLFSHRKLEVMQQIAREANTKFWGIGQSFVTLTLRFDMHDIRAFGRENWPLYAYMAQKNTLLDGKRRRGKEKQRDYVIQKAHILSLHVPTASMPYSKVFFCTMWPYSAKGLYRAVNSIAWTDLMYGTLYPFFQRFYSVLNSPGRPLTMHFLQVLSDHSSLIRCVNSVRRTLSYQQTLNGWSSHVSTSARRRMSVWYPSLMWTLFTRMNSWAAPTGSLSRL